MKSPGPASATNSSRSPHLMRAQPAHHIDHALDGPVMVRPRLRHRPDDDRSGPQLLRASAGVRDGRGAGHALGLRGVEVEFVRMNDSNPVETPARLVAIVHGGSPNARPRAEAHENTELRAVYRQKRGSNSGWRWRTRRRKTGDDRALARDGSNTPDSAGADRWRAHRHRGA